MRILGVPNMDIKSVALFLAFISMGFVGCHKSTPMWPQSTFTDRSYVDLQPGWRIRVVVPVHEVREGEVGDRREAVRHTWRYEQTLLVLVTEFDAESRALRW